MPLHTITNTPERTSLQDASNDVVSWSKHNNMKVNVSKTKETRLHSGEMQTWPIYLTSNNSCQRDDQKRVFCTYWPCDLDLWPLDLKNIPAPEFMSMKICAKFEHSNFICAWAMVWTNKYTHSLARSPPRSDTDGKNALVVLPHRGKVHHAGRNRKILKSHRNR